MNKIGILTSGGDAPGMNAALRSAVRFALELGIGIYAINEGYQGMVEGGDKIRELSWDSVGGILQRGGTVIGTARCDEFRTREGRKKAAKNLVENGIDGLIIIGGDGSLTGASIFRTEWPELIAELVKSKDLPKGSVEKHPNLIFVGLPGSIDNDMYGTDMTIGADTALHRITEVIDAITSTASSHQRSFVVEVMGRKCGYLAMMGALAAGADWLFIPEVPPDPDTWRDEMCEALKAGREVGRRDSIVVLAEGAHDKDGTPITSQDIKETLEEQIGEDTRITVLGHYQRGGSPSAFDRNLGTLLGHAAVLHLKETSPEDPPQLIGMRGNRVESSHLMECVDLTQQIAAYADENKYDKVLELRGAGFKSTYEILKTMMQSEPKPRKEGAKCCRIAVMHSGGPAPGMNTIVRAAVRWGADLGQTMLGVSNGFPGLIKGDIKELNWMDVRGMVGLGGAELGTNRTVPTDGDYYAIARTIEEQKIDAILMIGGEAGYDSVNEIFNRKKEFPNFQIPIVCLPATIDNDRPGSELSIGADTALNSIIQAVDQIKQSAVASRRCFVVETMGNFCGYLALMGGLATGAERVYIHEEGITLQDLQDDVDHLVTGFSQGKRLGLMIRNESAHPVYTTDFMVRLFEVEGKELFDVRQAILGHQQQGGNPSPFDRIQGVRLAVQSVDFLLNEIGEKEPRQVFIGSEGGKIQFTGMEDYQRLEDRDFGRPKKQWWMDLRPIVRVLAQPGPGQWK
ncbi:MAG: 6-phosphofructokinase [Chloroflexota bacterium]|nr:MAG: 6-phosphofructokinase [Chloroflexota bacterium]HDD61825.1 6-phosphofructokinase [Chloroflexota bacterium]